MFFGRGEHFWSKFSEGTLKAAIVIMFLDALSFMGTIIYGIDMEPGLVVFLLIIELGLFLLGAKIFLVSLFTRFLAWCYR